MIDGSFDSSWFNDREPLSYSSCDVEQSNIDWSKIPVSIDPAAGELNDLRSRRYDKNFDDENV